MDCCLAAEVAADWKRNEHRLLPVIGAFWARETTPDARRGVDGWSRLDGSGYRLSLRDWGDLRRQLSRATESTRADASRTSSGNGNGNRRCVWCERNDSD
ncbi:hypothetical protein V6N13_024620 [Hibiscus sabdariffa]|uniref:Uncharacterized protein n=2 Tax=Hibiscus sabdariffa TaxID=183260 RepID=A0ABR2DV59_9ROSI